MTSNKQAQNEQNGSVNWEEVRSQFPILKQNIHSHKLVYLDSAATSQKPQCVIDAESKFYSSINAGVLRLLLKTRAKLLPGFSVLTAAKETRKLS